jgi:hypothetical protein
MSQGIHSANHSRNRLFCAVAYACAFLVLAEVLHSHPGFPLDDSWIHQVIAQNLAQTHHLGFVPGQLTAGSTSLLWSCLLALYWLVFPGISPVFTAACTSVILLARIGYTFKAITEEDALSPAASWCVALAPLASGNFLWFGLTGMEHLLFILLSLCLIRQWTKPMEQRNNSDLFLLCLYGLLLVLTRPEGLFLAGLLLFTLRFANRKISALAAVLAGAFVAGVALSATNWAIGHHLIPQTMQGRQFLYRVSPQDGLRLRLDFFGQIVARCLKTWSFFTERSLLHGSGLVLGIPLVLFLAGLTGIALRRLYKLRARRLLLLWTWAAVIVLLYAAVLPSTGHGGRYLALPLMLFLPLEFLGLQTILSSFTSLRRFSWPIVACIAIVSGTWSIHAWRLATVAQITQIENEHGAMANWLTRNLPLGSIAHRELAVFDVGRMGYQLNGDTVDLGGLVDPAYLGFVSRSRTADYLLLHHVRYVVLPSEADNDSTDFARRLSLDPAHGVTLSPLHNICVDPATAALAESSAITAYACQRTYRLIYNDIPQSMNRKPGNDKPQP